MCGPALRVSAARRRLTEGREGRPRPPATAPVAHEGSSNGRLVFVLDG